MNKVLEFFKKIPNAYYKWKNRNEQLETFLQNSAKNHEQINHIDATVTNLETEVGTIKKQVGSLENRVVGF